MAENEIQSLFLKMAKLQCKLDPQLCRMSAVEMRVLIAVGAGQGGILKIGMMTHGKSLMSLELA